MIKTNITHYIFYSVFCIICYLRAAYCTTRFHVFISANSNREYLSILTLCSLFAYLYNVHDIHSHDLINSCQILCERQIARFTLCEGKLIAIFKKHYKNEKMCNICEIKDRTPPPNQPVCECILLYIYVCGYASIETSIETGPSNLAQAEHSPLFDRELGDTSEQS